MESDEVKFKLLAAALGLKNADSLEDRRLFGHKMMLAQHFGLNAGYSFQWWVSGPTSSDLTEEIYKYSGTKI